MVECSEHRHEFDIIFADIVNVRFGRRNGREPGLEQIQRTTSRRVEFYNSRLSFGGLRLEGEKLSTFERCISNLQPRTNVEKVDFAQSAFEPSKGKTTDWSTLHDDSRLH